MTQKNSTYNFSNVVILGGGISGMGAAMLAADRGYKVFLSNRDELSDAFAKALQTHNIPYESGSHTVETILAASLIVKSPGIPDTAGIIKEAIGAGIPVISEIEFAAEHSNETIIAVTGSKYYVT